MQDLLGGKMGTFDVATAVISGGTDVFDKVIGMFEYVEEKLNEAHPEEERLVAFHPGDGPVPEGFSVIDDVQTAERGIPYIKPHFHDPIASLLEEIEAAKVTVRELDLLYQEALKAI